MNKHVDNVEEIDCPHCGENQYMESCDQPGLTTYWGEEAVDHTCHKCGKDFLIQEWVTRSWSVAKTLDEL